MVGVLVLLSHSNWENMAPQNEENETELFLRNKTRRAIPVKVAAKRLHVFPFSGLLKGCNSHKTHRFENGGANQIRKTGKREVVLLQPLPQTL